MSYFTVITILLGAASAAFAWWTVHRVSAVREAAAAVSEAGEELLAEGSDREFLERGADLNRPEEARRTLGEEAYGRMNRTLSVLLSRHMFDDYLTVPLDSCRLNHDCSHVLHHLIPGDRAVLLPKVTEGVPVCMVFANGRHIGNLASGTYPFIRELMKDSEIRGVYVWRQSSFGNTDTTDMDLMVFSRKRTRAIGMCGGSSPDRVEVGSGSPFTVFQN